jgi:NAD(P)-dependent dehydrogenase (short-subunit alcohol dehydrogenase family)
MTKGMQGKVALVTGGASGIGRVTAQTFAREGIKVIVATDANIKGAEETVRLIKEAGGKAVFIRNPKECLTKVQASAYIKRVLGLKLAF